MYDACRLLVGGVRVVSMCKLMGAGKCENEDVSVPSFVLCGLAVDDIVPSLIPRLY